jgi:hypothetical protein
MLDIQHTQGTPELIQRFLTTGAASLMALGAARWQVLRVERTDVTARVATAVVAREGAQDTALSWEFEVPPIVSCRERVAR